MISVAATLLSALALSAEDGALEIFSGKVASGCVTFSYGYSVNTGVRMTGNGDVAIQGQAFRMAVNGMEIYCDGKTRWTVDRAAEEVIVETSDGYALDIASNPALLVSAASEYFDTVSESPSSFGSMPCVKLVLKPSVPGTGLLQVILYLSSDCSFLYGASVISKDKTGTDFTVSAFEISGYRDMSVFSFDVDSLSSSWIVTDLR